MRSANITQTLQNATCQQAEPDRSLCIEDGLPLFVTELNTTTSYVRACQDATRGAPYLRALQDCVYTTSTLTQISESNCNPVIDTLLVFAAGVALAAAGLTLAALVVGYFWHQCASCLRTSPLSDESVWLSRGGV